MELCSLLLSQDGETIDVLQQALSDLGIAVEVFLSSSLAYENERQNKFDAVIVDCDTDGGTDFLKSIQTSLTNSQSLIFAIVSSDIGLPAAFQMGASLALQKPLALEAVRSSLRTAYGLILQERRRHFRYPVDLPVQIYPDEQTIIHATAINLSEGGMALKCERELSENTQVRLSFYLPGTKSGMELNARVIWKDLLGRIGVRFDATNVTTRHRLNQWLEAQVAVY